MPLETAALLRDPKTGYAGRKFASKCRVQGHEGEWFIRRRSRNTSRVIRIRPDGLSEDVGYVVETGHLNDVRPSGPSTTQPLQRVSQVGPRRSIVLQAALCDANGLTEGSFIIQEQTPDGILIRPAVVTVVTPRLRPAAAATRSADLDELLSRVTPENIHAEIDFGRAVGAELE